MAAGERPERGKVVHGPWLPLTPGPGRDEKNGGPAGPGGGDMPPPGIDLAARIAGLAERVARLEAAVEGLRHSQNVTTGAMAAVAAVIIGIGVYGLQRIDQTQDTISREAAATRQELVGVTNAIASSITAAREMRPPIVVVPPGALPPSSPGK